MSIASNDESVDQTIDALANHQIVTLAVFLCGGQLHPVDTEDIAVKAHEIAPSRFAWRKYPEQISLDAVRKRLWDAKSAEKGYCYVSGSERSGGILTPEGQKFATEHLGATSTNALPRTRLSREEQRWVTRERARLLELPAIKKTIDGQTDKLTRRELESVFRVDDYVIGEARTRKVSRLLNLLGNDPVLGPPIQELAKLIKMDPAK